MARVKCLMRDFINFNRIYKAHRTIVWWTMKVFRLHCLHIPYSQCHDDGDFAHAVLGVPCETTRHGCSLWCLYPHYPFSDSYFLFGNEYRKTSLEKILGNFSFVSIYYHWNWFEDLHYVQGIEIKDDSEMLHSQYLRENNGTTCHHGHPADCQLALTNVVEVQTKVVTND